MNEEHMQMVQQFRELTGHCFTMETTEEMEMSFLPLWDKNIQNLYKIADRVDSMIGSYRDMCRDSLNVPTDANEELRMVKAFKSATMVSLHFDARNNSTPKHFIELWKEWCRNFRSMIAFVDSKADWMRALKTEEGK